MYFAGYVQDGGRGCCNAANQLLGYCRNEPSNNKVSHEDCTNACTLLGSCKGYYNSVDGRGYCFLITDTNDCPHGLPHAVYVDKTGDIVPNGTCRGSGYSSCYIKQRSKKKSKYKE